jgi:putative tryptophan/tyrosine transport system substrate-binding protein
MRRRDAIAVLGTLAFSPLAALAQRKEMARIGVLATTSFFMTRFGAFRQGMRDLGYVEGKSLAFEYRYAEGKFERFPGLAAELARSNVDLIFTASAEGVLAAMKATSTIPIVFGTVQDPVASGIVASLARPGRNATGMSALAPDLGRKRLDILREASPGLVRVGYLWSPISKGSDVGMRETQAAAQSLGLQIQSLEVREPKDLDRALEAAMKQRAQALITAPDPQINAQGVRIAAFAASNRLPVMYAAPEHVEAGGLMTYAPSYSDMWRHAATFADKILKGARPADLPVEQPTKFELIVNLKAARAIGLAIPQTILFRADRVIE